MLGHISYVCVFHAQMLNVSVLYNSSGPSPKNNEFKYRGCLHFSGPAGANLGGIRTVIQSRLFIVPCPRASAECCGEGGADDNRAKRSKQMTCECIRRVLSAGETNRLPHDICNIHEHHIIQHMKLTDEMHVHTI